MEIEVNINEEAQQTKDYLRFVLQELDGDGRRKPLDVVTLDVDERTKRFPQLRERVVVTKEGNSDLIKKLEQREGYGYKYPELRQKYLFAILDSQPHALKKITAVEQWTDRQLRDVCTFPLWQEISTKPIHYAVKYTIGNAKKLHALARPTQAVLYLTPHGELWREPREEYRCEFKERGHRYKVLHYLATRADYQQTEDIREAVGAKDNRSVSKTIEGLRRKIKGTLHIQDLEVIEGKSDSGYRINPKFRITVEDA